MVRSSLVVGVVSVFTLASGAAAAQEHEHGAAAAEKLGTVHFATSCSAAAQPSFDRAVALLHSFEFGRAIAGFDATLKADPSCTISYWGIALSRWGNPFAVGAKPAAAQQQGRAAIERAKASPPKTDREKAYVDAASKLYADFERTPQTPRVIAYRDAMAALAARYPDDTEASIFYALSLAFAADPSDKTYVNQKKAGAILQSLFAKQPDHPGLAHYIIHSYDVPPLANYALEAARRYAKIAPSAPHFALAAIPARYALERGDWKAAATLEPRQSAFPYTEAMTYFARALGAARLGDAATIRASIDALLQSRDRLTQANETYWAEQVEIQRRGAAAWLALVEGRKQDALAEMRATAEREDATEKSAVTPGPLAPARALLREILLQIHAPAQALREFATTLRKEPNRFRAVAGAAKAAAASGNRVAARTFSDQLLKICAKADTPGRPELQLARQTVTRSGAR